MTGRVHVEPENVRIAAGSASDVAHRLARIADKTRAAISPGASAWGDDEFGGKFADGSKGFGDGSSNTADSTATLADSFSNLASGMRKTAKKLENMEHGNTESF
ncbi:hypothetical protein AB0N05_21840 [Nocardia sp. NPDC051030]|uniref:hypothetical protein n=1 Tax=Nocardia sp. NPDC051030 TaxID=3155162 RepID=UPI0034191E0C